jgi:hypothetical protein
MDTSRFSMISFPKLIIFSRFVLVAEGGKLIFGQKNKITST